MQTLGSWVVLIGLVVACAACSANATQKDAAPAHDAGPSTAGASGAAGGASGAGGGVGTGTGLDAGEIDAGLAADGGSPGTLHCALEELECGGVCTSDVASYMSCGCAKTACTISQICAFAECTSSEDVPSAGTENAWVADDEGIYVLEAVGAPATVYRQSNAAVPTPYQVVGKETTFDTVEHSDLVMDSTYVYFGLEDSHGQKIFRMPKTGGDAQLLATEASEYLHGNAVAVDASYVYWIGEKGINRTSINGGTPELWAKSLCADQLIVTHGWAYFYCGENAGVYRRKTSEPPELDASKIELRAKNFVESAVFGRDSALTHVAGDFLYYIDDHTIEAVSLVNEESRSYPLPVLRVSGFCVDGTRFYVSAQLTDDGEFMLLLFPKLGDTHYELVAHAPSDFDGIHGISGDYLYFTSFSQEYRVLRR